MKSILILDDDPTLLKAITLYLERSAYKVASAVSAEAAAQKFQNLRGGFDLFIADLSMKVRSGVEVATQLHEGHPGLKVVLMSGYPVEVWNQHDASLFAGLPSDSVRILQKPFSPTDLSQLVEQLIGPADGLTQPAAKKILCSICAQPRRTA